jgi:hypothetical protein
VLLEKLNLQSFVNEKFVTDLTESNLSWLKVANFLIYCKQKISNNSNSGKRSIEMAIQKHLAKTNNPQTNSDVVINITEILRFIESGQDHFHTHYQLLKVLIHLLARISLTRNQDEMKQSREAVNRVGEYFAEKSEYLSTEEKFKLLNDVYHRLTRKSQTPEETILIGFLVIPENMIGEAVEHLFKSFQDDGSAKEIVTALGMLLNWVRTSYIPVPLDIWITQTIYLLHTHGFNDVIDKLAVEYIERMFLSLILPLYQLKTFAVVQSFFKYSRNTQEVFDIILPRASNVIKQVERNVQLLETVLDVLCEALGKFDHEFVKYQSIVSVVLLFHVVKFIY